MILTYNIGGLPGQFTPSFNWSNQPKLNLSAPFGALAPGQVVQAAGALLGLAPTDGLPANFEQNSGFLIGALSQYLYVKQDSATVAQYLKSGQPLSGLGVFAKFGFAPEQTNTITRDAAAAVFAHGLFDQRPYDSFGVGYFYNGFGGDFKNAVWSYTHVNVGDEQGVEAFYDFALTPAIRVIPSYQHLWNPVVAQVAANNRSADVFLTRLTIAW